MRYLHSRHNSKLTLSSEEIQHISQTISATYHPLKFSQSEPLNFPQLIILPIDPYHLHAYWRVLGSSEALPACERDQASLILRLFWQFDFVGANESCGSWFDVGEVSAQADAKIKLPVAGAVYIAAIGQYDSQGGFVVHAHSQPVCMPSCEMITVVPIQTIQSASSTFDEAEIDSKIRQTLTEVSGASTPLSGFCSMPLEWCKLNGLDNHSSIGTAYLQSSASIHSGS